MEILDKIKRHTPYNEQESVDKEVIINFISGNDNAFYRENKIAHVTASAWVTNKVRSKVLMAYHNIYDSWSWLGGHADGETDLLAVAIREVKEESGLSDVTPITDEIFSLESLVVNGHMKHGAYVPSHLHLNITFALEANENDELTINLGENSGVEWFYLDEAAKKSSEKWFVDNIYTKLNSKSLNFAPGISSGT